MADLRYALRQLLKHPGFACIALAIVALGIGSATTIFSAVNALILQPPDWHQPERLVAVYESNLPRNAPFFSSSYPNYVDWRDRSRSWESLGAVAGRPMNLTGGDQAEYLQVRAMTANLLPTLGLRLALGRGFQVEEDRPGQNRVAVVSHGFWQRHFGGDPQVLGQSIELDGVRHEVIGVTAANAVFPGGMEIGVPLGADLATERRMNHELDVYGRLNPGISLAEADAELKSIAAQIWAEHPELDRGWSTRLVPLVKDLVAPEVLTGLWVLLGAVGLLLLIAIANFSNLLLIRSSARSHELAVRTALGASRIRVLRQLLTETLVLTVLGGVLGILVSLGAVEILWASDLPRAREIVLDARVLSVALVLTLMAGVLAGVGPALKASQTQPQEALRGRSPRSGHRSRWRDGLVVAQLALSFTLLIGSSMLLRSFWRLQHVNPGFTTERVLSVSLRPQDNERAAQFYERVTERIASLPEVEGVGLISSLPLTDGNTSNNILPVGPSPLPEGDSIQASWRLVDGGYFGALQIPLLRGATFGGLNPGRASQSIILSASLARQLFGEDDPIGRQTERGGKGGARLTVIGVVGDVRSERLNLKPAPTFYMSMHRFVYGPMRLVIRTRGSVEPLMASVRQVVRELDPKVPVFRVQTMEDFRSESLSRERLIAGLITGFAVSALFLAALGTYGVMAFTVQQRTREIGIRIAVGAEASDVVKLMIVQAARLVGVGLGLGVVVAIAAGRLLTSLLYEIRPFDPLSYCVAAFALLFAAWMAGLIPALRAIRIDPLVALRNE